MDKILVTGGAGFIGSHIVEELVLLDHKVTVIDDLSSGNLENISQFDKEHVEFIKMDIRDEQAIAKLFNDKMFDVVFHQAAIASVHKSITEKEYTKSVNVQGTENIFKNAVRTGVDKVIFASSAAVYGDDPTLPKNEFMQLRPVSPYGEHKMINEDMALIYSEKASTQFLGLRYFNVYGERQNPSSEYSGVISIFQNKISKGEDVVVHGDGDQTRDFVYIKDVVTANIMMMMSYQDYSVYNVGTGRQNSVNDLVSSFKEIYAKDVKAVYLPAREGDIRFSIADISRIKNDFSYFPRYNLQQGLSRLCGITL